MEVISCKIPVSLCVEISDFLVGYLDPSLSWSEVRQWSVFLVLSLEGNILIPMVLEIRVCTTQEIC